MGTPSYMPPEQVQGNAVNGRADQFSLAVIAYEVLTGEKPFAAEYLPTLLYKIVREEPLAAQRINPTLNAQVDTVLRRGLAKIPDERFETCVDFINALSTALSANKGWTPLPRGAGQNMPTVGSQEGLETIDDRGAPPATIPPPLPAPAAAPRELRITPDLPIEPVARRMPPAEISHVGRNLLLSAGVVALLIAGSFLVIQKFTATPKPQAAGQDAAQGGAAQAAQGATPDTSQPPPQQTQPEPTTPPQDQQSAPAPPGPDASTSPKETAPQQEPEQVKLTPAKPTPAKPAPVISRPKAVAPPSDSQFQLTTTPPGAEAVFDYGPKCTTPCSMTLTPGRHTFAVHSPGYREARKIIEIPQDTGLIVDLVRATGMLTLLSRPAGCAIAIDGQEQSQKTPATLMLAAGTHKIQVRRGDFKQEFTVDVRDGAILTRTVELSSQ